MSGLGVLVESWATDVGRKILSGLKQSPIFGRFLNTPDFAWRPMALLIPILDLVAKSRRIMKFEFCFMYTTHTVINDSNSYVLKNFVDIFYIFGRKSDKILPRTCQGCFAAILRM